MPNENRIKVVIANPGEKSEAVEINDTLEAFQKIVGGYIEILPDRMGDGLDILINEDGRGRELPPNRIIRSFGIVGPILVTASTSEGEPRSLTDDEVALARLMLGDG